MVVVNGAVYFSKEDDEKYIAGCLEIDQLGTGASKDEAIKDLGTALKQVFGLAKESEDIALFSRSANSDILNIIQNATLNPTKYTLKKQRINNSLTLHVYSPKRQR